MILYLETFERSISIKYFLLSYHIINNMDISSNHQLENMKYIDILQNYFDFSNVKRYSYSTIVIFSLAWVFYIYGIFEIGWNKVHFSLSTPLSPPNESFIFASISHFPNCNDIRYQVWRIISYQFVHEGLQHIGGNTFVGLLYGMLLESYIIGGHFSVLIVNQLGVIFGALAYSYLFPYGTIVGNSSGFYAFIGCNISMLIMDYENMDKLAILISFSILIFQTISDILSYFFMYNSNTAYIAHVGGYIIGLSFGLAIYMYKKSKWKRFLAFCGLIIFTSEIGFLIYHYSKIWPPHIVESSFRVKEDASSCCSWLFDTMEATGLTKSVVEESLECSI